VNGRVPVRTIDKDIEWKITRIFEVEANVIQINEMNSTVQDQCHPQPRSAVGDVQPLAVDRPDDEEGKRIAANDILEDLPQLVV